MGRSGIVNVEREVNMSGTSHSKGVMILSGYMGTVCSGSAIGLNANITFEQLYGGWTEIAHQALSYTYCQPFRNPMGQGMLLLVL